MVYNPNKELKMYYSIGEVAEIFDVNETLLRYWEKEFPFLSPRKSEKSKSRQYSKKDIENIRTIYNLVKVRGLKISAARTLLNKNKEGTVNTALVVDRLKDIREQLVSIRKNFHDLE